MSNNFYDIDNFHLNEEQISALKAWYMDENNVIETLSPIELLAIWLGSGIEGKPIRSAKMGRALNLSAGEGAAIHFLAQAKIHNKHDDPSIVELAQRYEALAASQYAVRKYHQAVENYENALKIWRDFTPTTVAVVSELRYSNCLVRLGKAKNCADDTRSRKEFEEAIQICEERAASSATQPAWGILARAYFYMGQLMKYLSSQQEFYYFKARDLAEQHVRRYIDPETSRLLVDIYISLADFYLDDTPRYLSCCDRARRISEAIVDKNYDYYDSVVLGSIYETMAARIFEDNEDAEHPVFSQAEINLAKAIAHYSNALSFEEYRDAEAGLMHCFSYIWEINTRRGSASQSEEEFQKAYDALLSDLKDKRDKYNAD